MKNKIKIAIVDYGLGNTLSVLNAIKYLGYRVIISRNEKELKEADVLILPGVGAFEKAIQNIKSQGLDKILEEIVISNYKPLLGICVGMQLLAETSEENGLHQGLGWIKGNIKKINPLNQDRVPHVGWNDIHFSNSILYSRIGLHNNFYFDHGYHFQCDDKYKSATCLYGGQLITASVQFENIYGVQFHPEKSHNSGLKLFRGFFESLNV